MDYLTIPINCIKLGASRIVSEGSFPSGVNQRCSSLLIVSEPITVQRWTFRVGISFSPAVEARYLSITKISQHIVRFSSHLLPDLLRTSFLSNFTKLAGAYSSGTVSCFCPDKRCLHSKERLPPRGVAASGFRPLRNIPGCCHP